MGSCSLMGPNELTQLSPPGSASALIRLRVAFLVSFSHVGPGKPPRQRDGSPVEMLLGSVLKT